MSIAKFAGLDLNSMEGMVFTALFAVCGAYLLKSYVFSESVKQAPAPAAVKAPIVKNRNIVKKLQEVGSNVVIFFGSQTGTAEDFSGRLAKEAKQRFGVNCLVADIDDYDMDQLDTIPEEYLAIFVMATYGEGEPTDNASDFYHMFVDQTDAPWSEGITDVSESPLKNLRYIVFGLGNRTYEHFNHTAIKVDEFLTKFGAKRYFEVGMGDDDGSLEDDFIKWKDPMWKHFCEALEIDFENAGNQKVQATMAISEVDPADQTGDVYQGQLIDPNAKIVPGSPVTYDAKNPFYAPVKITRELFADNCGRHCVHLELDITGTNISYQTGDHVGVWATNPESEVQLIAKAFGLTEKLNQAITAINTDPTAAKKYPFPVPTTYLTMFRHYVDICAAPSRQFLTQVVTLAKTDAAKDYLNSISSDLEKYTNAVTNYRLTMAEIILRIQELEAKSNEKTVIPLELVVENLGRILPRFYSISSSNKVHPKNVHVTASVLEFSPKDLQERKVYGLFTNYLLAVHNHLIGSDQPTHQYHLEPQTDQSVLTIPMFIRKSNFALPKSPKTPVIMIGPGTGVAPFRGFVQDRAYSAQQGQEVGATILYFGCRTREEDFLYSNEWESLFNALPGDESKMINAFSREQTEKVYVQHLLKKDSELMWKLINEQNAHIYVCGDAKYMAKDVNNVFIDIAQQQGQLNEQHAINYVKKLRSQNRYQEDVWA
jgi:NADPH-ferrihemoprotein reductase